MLRTYRNVASRPYPHLGVHIGRSKERIADPREDLFRYREKPGLVRGKIIAWRKRKAAEQRYTREYLGGD